MKTLPTVVPIPTENLVSLFLFSIALIMEYSVRIVSAKKIATRLLPMIVVGISIWDAYITFCALVGNAYDIGLEYLYYGTIVPLVIIGIDVIIYLLLGKPREMKEQQVESKLKNVGVSK